jgi:hypothetical protein
MLIDSVDLLSDRVNFKLYAAERHLQTLKKLQKESGNLAGSGTRISAISVRIINKLPQNTIIQIASSV